MLYRGSFPREQKNMSRYHGNEHSKEENDNHANQLNPNNDAYWSSRGCESEEEEEEKD